MERTRKRLQRKKVPKVYAVTVAGSNGFYFVTTEKYSWRPTLMSYKDAMILKAKLEQEYYGQFKIEKHD